MNESSGFSAAFIRSISPSRRATGAEAEQSVLDARQHRIGIALRVEPREADRRIGFVDGAEGVDPQRLFRDPAAVAERGLARVAAARIDAGEADHRASGGSPTASAAPAPGAPPPASRPAPASACWSAAGC